uniref:Uncharacterized protein n=1 Tax=Meiothermus ruber TaxID=277 RepID=A0A7C3DRX3_MEIRU
MVVGLVLLLAACGTQQIKTAHDAQPWDGEPVPLALAQALTLGMKVSAGGVSLQEAKTYKFASEIVYDLSLKPLHHLLLVGPETTDFWGTIANPGDKNYALYAVGATDKRSFFSFIIPAGSFKSLAETRAKAGSFRRFLSPSVGVLYLEDNTGRVWDVNTATEVGAEQMKVWRQAQRVLFEQRQKDGILDKIKEDWDRLRTEASQKGLAQSGGLPTLDEVTLPNGHLDVPKLITALEAQKAAKGVSANYTNERAWCMGWFCAGMGYASVVRKNRYNGDLANNNLYNPDNPQDYSDCNISGQKCRIANDIHNADPLGNLQWINYYRYAPADGYWGAWDAGLSGLGRLNNIGCGPLAITRLFAWYATERQNYGSYNVNFINSGTAPSTAYVIAQEMFEPVYLGTRDGQNVYQPRIARYTDTWWFQNSDQGLTRDTNMIPGANNWIRDRASAEGKNWEMRGSHKAWVNIVYAATGWTVVAIPIAWIDFSQHTWRVRDIARGKIGRDNEPVIAMYGQGTLGHFAMSQAYIVHEGWFSANVFLWIRREANSWAQDLLQGSFVNVTDMASYYSGAFGMYRR